MDIQTLQKYLEASIAIVGPKEEWLRIARRPKDAVKLASSGKRQGNGPDVMCRAPRSIFLASLTKAVDPSVVRVEVRTLGGVDRVRTFKNGQELAEELLENFPEKLGEVCVDARVTENGSILFTSKAHALKQRSLGYLQCRECACFQKGVRGLRDHQLVQHGTDYISSVENSKNAQFALMKYEPCRFQQELLTVSRPTRKRPPPHPIVAAVKDGDFALLKSLVESEGYDPKAIVDPDGSSCLEWAAGLGYLDIAKYLIDVCKVDPEKPNAKGLRRTPLHWACRNGHLKTIVRYLIEDKRVDPDAQMADGSTPFHYAVYGDRIDVCEYLVTIPKINIHSLNSHGCNATQWCALTGSTSMFELLDRLGLDFTLLNKNGHSVLHKTAQRGHFEASKWILEHINGNFVSVADNSGMLPADLAKTNGFAKLAEYLERQQPKAHV